MQQYQIAGSRIPQLESSPSEALRGIIASRYSAGRTWYLPHPSRAYDFWRDYFQTCAAAGVTFAKVDNQASISLLGDLDGAEAGAALWNGMFRAANDVFGPNRVIHCMAHHERMFVGDIATGVATDGQSVVFRNTNDFGLAAYTHSQHVLYNIYNSLVLSNTCLQLDADMFMTSAKWPEYNAVLRAFFPGPVLLSDHDGEHDLKVIEGMIGRYRCSSEIRTLRAKKPLRPLASRMWDAGAESAVGPAIKASTTFQSLDSAVIVAWSPASTMDTSIDIIVEADVRDALELTSECGGDYVLWFTNARKAVQIALQPASIESKSLSSHTSAPIATLVLPPEGHEVLAIVPFYTVGLSALKIAFLGLVDKYASLAAVEKLVVEEDCVSANIPYEGTAAFITNSQSTTLVVDGEEISGTKSKLGEGMWLIEVPLFEKEAGLMSKEHWTVRLLQ